VGLFRSEFLFLTPGKSADEERQYASYRYVVEKMKGLPVTIRTVDFGGDKILPDMQFSEKNPLLGWRALRFSLANPELFKTQLRAILRASAPGSAASKAAGSVRIMFPMISAVEELEQALILLEEAKGECRKRGQAFDENIEAGAMIETPSAAMTADILAAKSAFFSIGTNDLIQYTLAVDRGNERVSYLSRPEHPAVLRLLKRTIDAAHERGIKAAMCGELAGDPAATAVLVGLGLDEFSMSASSIPIIKRIVRRVSFSECRSLAETVLSGRTADDNSRIVREWMANLPPEE
jgi:phosphotransferase system enzyme I (PtsI)